MNNIIDAAERFVDRQEPWIRKQTSRIKTLSIVEMVTQVALLH